MANDTALTIACVQNCATAEVEENLATLESLIRQAVEAGANLVALPEACDYLSDAVDGMRRYARPADEHVALQVLAGQAKKLRIWLLIGSLTMRDDNERVVNRSLLIDDQGELRAWYDKIHMFDANIPGMKMSAESAIYQPGEYATTAALPWGELGLSICYDLRFPQLYRELAQAGAVLLSVPAAFMRTTGEAHWHALLRSRAIENGCFVIAPAQWGNPYGNRHSYGHSLIVDPWGKILADAGDGDGLATARLDMQRVAECRHVIASLRHDRSFRSRRFP